MGQLKPCPFCGSSNVDFCVPQNIMFIECHDCGACGPNYEGAIIEEASRQAMRLWNGQQVDFLRASLPLSSAPTNAADAGGKEQL